MSLPPTSPSATGTPSGHAVPDRNVLRSKLIRARKALDPAEGESHSAAVQRRVLALPEWRDARTVAMYIAVRNEISTDEIIRRAWAEGKQCRNIKGCMYTVYPHSIITIGNDTGMSSACLWANTSITIGNYVKIGGDCIIMDTDAHSLDYMVRRLREKNADGFGMDGLSAATAPIVIEDDVLIGTRCIILKGVTIGARSIIGSGSVVVKSIPADCIAAGNPCKIIRYINGK